MMSLQLFAERCGALIKQRVPFIAYRHSRGCALLILDAGERTEYTIKYKYRVGDKIHTAKEATTDPKRVRELLARSGEVVKERVVHKTPMAATVAGFRRAIQKMKKEKGVRWSLYTVECSGMGYVIEGPDQDLREMLEAMGL